MHINYFNLHSQTFAGNTALKWKYIIIIIIVPSVYVWNIVIQWENVPSKELPNKILQEPSAVL